MTKQIRLLLALGSVISAVTSCTTQPQPASPTAPAPDARAARPPKVEVAWAGETSIYDVLGKDTGGPPRAVMVKHRTSADEGVRQAGPSFPGLEVFTRCHQDDTKAVCADGLRRTDSQPPEPSIIVGAEICCGDLEAVSAQGSWLERGIRVVSAGARLVSFYQATAWFSGGAAHSTAELRCLTHRCRGPEIQGVVPLSGVLPEEQARAVLEAVRRFIDEAREAGEPWAGDLDLSHAAELRRESDFVMPKEDPPTFEFCIPSAVEASAGFVQRIRATLVDPGSGRDR